MRKIKVDDTVVVLKGKDKGKEGIVLSINYAKRTIVVKDLNLKTIYVKQTENEEGGIKTVEKPFDISNVSVKDPKSGQPTRIKVAVEGKNKTRVSVKSNSDIK